MFISLFCRVVCEDSSVSRVYRNLYFYSKFFEFFSPVLSTKDLERVSRTYSLVMTDIAFPTRRSTSSGRYDGILDSEMCELSEWSSWSSCSSTCGEGSKTRSRNFRQKKYRKQCKAVPNGPNLQQSVECENEPCEDEDAEEVREDANHVENNYEDYGEWADGTGEVIEDWLEVRGI